MELASLKIPAGVFAEESTTLSSCHFATLVFHLLEKSFFSRQNQVTRVFVKDLDLRLSQIGRFLVLS